MDLEFDGEIWYWRGPSPFHFVTVPSDQGADIHAVAGALSYGWGCIPATATVGRTRWTTALIPRDGTYLVPMKSRVRQAEGLELADTVTIRLSLGGGSDRG